MVIFCWTQVETNTSTGMVMSKGPVGSSERSIPRKSGSKGTAG